MMSYPHSDTDYFLSNWQSMIYGRDNHGHLLFAERYKTINAKNILSRFPTDDEMMKARAVVMESMDRLKGVLNPKKPKTYKHVYIFDLSGLELKAFSPQIRRVVKNVVIEMGNIYPESVHKVLFVNAPFTFRAIWGVVKPWLHPITTAKTKILGGGSGLIKDFIKNEIPLESIPDYFGGKHPGRDMLDFLNDWREERANEEASKPTEEELTAKVNALEVNDNGNSNNGNPDDSVEWVPTHAASLSPQAIVQVPAA